MAAPAAPALPLADSGRISATLTPPVPIVAPPCAAFSDAGEPENRSPVDRPPLPVHPDRIAPAATMSTTARRRLAVHGWNAWNITVPRRRTYTPKNDMPEFNTLPPHFATTIRRVLELCSTN